MSNNRNVRVCGIMQLMTLKSLFLKPFSFNVQPILLMLWFLIVLLAATVVKSVPSPEFAPNAGTGTEPVIDPIQDIRHSSHVLQQVEENVDPWDNTFLSAQDTRPFGLSPDHDDSNSPENNIYQKEKGVCKAKTRATIEKPQQPRYGVTLRPNHLIRVIVQESDPRCVNFWKRPVYVTCGGPEAYSAVDLIFDSTLVENCVAGKATLNILCIFSLNMQ